MSNYTETAKSLARQSGVNKMIQWGQAERLRPLPAQFSYSGWKKVRSSETRILLATHQLAATASQRRISWRERRGGSFTRGVQFKHWHDKIGIIRMECSTTTQAELLETSVTQCQPFSNSPVWSPFSKGSMTVNSESFEAKAHHSVPCSGLTVNICYKNDLERKFYPLTLILYRRLERFVRKGMECGKGRTDTGCPWGTEWGRIWTFWKKRALLNAGLYAQCTVRPNRNVEFGAEKVYFRARKGERGLCPQKSRPWRISAKPFQRQSWRGAWLVVANFLV